MEDVLISKGWHWSYGWLRRPDEDNEDGYCYEDGDGDLIYTMRRDHHTACYLECYQDVFTGERYLTLSQDSNKLNLERYGRLPARGIDRE